MTATRRQTQTNETGRCAVLYPAVAEAAARLDASRIALIDVGCSAGLNLNVDAYAVTYTPSEHTVGDASSSVQLRCEERGATAVPTRPMPEVVARIGIEGRSSSH